MKRTHCKCTHCNGKGYIPKKDPDTGIIDNMHCYHCNGTGKEEEFDNSLLEKREDENTFWSDTLLFALIFGGAAFLYWLFRYVWV